MDAYTTLLYEIFFIKVQIKCQKTWLFYVNMVLLYKLLDVLQYCCLTIEIKEIKSMVRKIFHIVKKCFFGQLLHLPSL